MIGPKSCRKNAIAVILFWFAAAIPLSAQAGEGSDARKIVELTNTVVAIGNAYSTTYRNYETFLDNSAKAYERYAAMYNGEAVKIAGGGPFHVPDAVFERYAAALDQVSGGWAGREPIERAVAFARDTTAMLENAVISLRNYFEQGRFDRDDFKSYPVLREAVVHYFESTRSSWDNAVNTAIETAREAELELLAGSPRAVFLIPMKTDLDALSTLIRDIFGMAEYDYDFGPYSRRNDSLKASIQKNRSTGDKDRSDMAAVTNYTMFYEYMSNVTKALSSLMSELARDKPNGSLVNTYIDQINKSYEAAIQRYNNF